MDVWVSGVAYEAGVRSSGVPAEEGWPEPTRHKHGRGERYLYVGGPDLAEAIASHFQLLGEGFEYGDLDTRAEGRELLANARRIRAAIRALEPDK